MRALHRDIQMRILALLAALLFGIPAAHAQSSAAQVVTGYLTEHRLSISDISAGILLRAVWCGRRKARHPTSASQASTVLLRHRLGAGILGVAISPTATAAAGITPVVSASLEASHVLKNAPGNLYSVFASNLTGGTVGNLQIFNATSAPSDGAVTPLVCVPFDAGGKAMAFYSPGPPAVFSTGIVAVISSAASCFTKTTGVLTGFISGMTQ